MSIAENFQPNHNRLLVQYLAEAARSKGGIIIPETVDEKKIMMVAKVIRVGPGYKTANEETGEYDKIIPLDVKAGDLVHIAKIDVTDIGGGYGVVSELDVWAVEDGIDVFEEVS